MRPPHPVRRQPEPVAVHSWAAGMFGQRLVEIECLELTTPIGGQTVLRLLGPKLIEVWISGVEALQDALDQLGPLNRRKQARLLGQLSDALVHKRQNSRRERRFEGWALQHTGRALPRYAN